MQDHRFGADLPDARAWRVGLGYPIAIGVATTVVAIPLALTQAAGGHETAWLMSALFPFAVVAAGFVSDSHASSAYAPVLAQVVGLAIAGLEFPTYGLVVGLVWLRQIDWLAVRLLVFMHLLTAAILIVSGDRFT